MWKNVSDDKKLSYSFNDGCSIELSFDKDKSYYEGESVIDGRQYFITRKGFWKTNVTLTKPDGNVVATLLQEKWYARKWRVQLDGFNYYVRYQNNPLFELIVEDYASEPVLKYKLLAGSDETAAELQVISHTEHKEHIHFLILIGWYIIVPIYIEDTNE
jgi:hypothetical protein